MILEAESDLGQRIATHVSDLRAKHRLSLEALASKSGVSRSMISLIERGESSPTAAVLLRLADALGVTLGSLFDPPSGDLGMPPSPVSRRTDQTEWQDPASGYRRRNVSPPGVRQPMQIAEMHFPPGQRVAFETGSNTLRIYQQVWVLEGVMEITVGTQRHRLQEGDCLALQLELPTLFHNPTRKPARYAVVAASEPLPRK